MLICTDGDQDEDTRGPRNRGSCVTDNKQHSHTALGDAEVVRRAQEEGCVSVVFPGTVPQEGCYRFVSEILKCLLYQKQQLPMTYDQLVYSQKKAQASMQVTRKLRQFSVFNRDDFKISSFSA